MNQAEIYQIESRVDAWMIHQWMTGTYRKWSWIIVIYLDGEFLESHVSLVHQGKRLRIDFIQKYFETLRKRQVIYIIHNSRLQVT